MIASYMMVFVSYLPRILIIALHLDNSIIVDSARVTLHVVRVEQPQVVVLLLVCHQVDKLSPLQWSGTGKVNPPGIFITTGLSAFCLFIIFIRKKEFSVSIEPLQNLDVPG